MNALLLYAGLALLCGMLIAVQAATNSVLHSALGNTLWVATILFGLGFVFLLCLILVLAPETPNWQAGLSAPPWAFIGGIVVASYVLTITFIVPRIGVANAIIFIVTGQLIAAVLIDHFGWFSVAVRAIDTQRIIGIVLLIVGAAAARL